jgi:gliding motility-associated-like protein
LILHLELNADDSLFFNKSIPLYQGSNYILICTNDSDSLLWAKSITKSSRISAIDITSDTTKNNIDLIINYNHTYDVITLDPSLNNGVNSNVYAIKLNPLTGIITQTKTILPNINYYFIGNRKLSWNPIAKKYFYSTYDYFGFLDSNLNLLSSHAAITGLGGVLNRNNSSRLHIDNKGYAYITGSIYDSIIFNCFTRYANPIHSYSKVVVTKIAPLITIDSNSCKPVTSPSGRYLWDTSGVYYDTIPSITNCDSVLEIRFTNLSSKINYDTSVHVFMQSPSGKYIWDSTGIYNDTLSNRFGCDSVIIFNLKILQTKHTIDTNVCDTYQSPSGIYWFDSTGAYTDTIPNTAGADSIITINLRVLKSFSNFDTSFCGSITSPSGKYIYNTSGIYTDTITNTVGCDSIIMIRFNLQQTTNTITVNSCNTFISPSGKYTYIQTGTYTDTLQTTQGCDSIIWIYYTNQKTIDTISLKNCDTIISPSGKFTMKFNGTYIDTLTNNKGCDSILFIQFTRDTFSVILSKSNDISCDSPMAYLTTSAGNLFTWFENGNLLEQKLATITVAPNNQTLYKLIAQNNLGCLATDSAIIYVDKKDSTVTFPNVFTPNNDGTNDCYSITGIEQYNKIIFEVYNRWGQLIFKTYNPVFCWNGLSNNGEEVLSGTYYYIFEGTSNCGNPLKTNGTITVIR